MADFKAMLGCALFVCAKFQTPNKAKIKAKLGLIKAKFTLNLTQIQLK